MTTLFCGATLLKNMNRQSQNLSIATLMQKNIEGAVGLTLFSLTLAPPKKSWTLLSLTGQLPSCPMMAILCG